jgi:positive regulator of sigma E activity
MKKSLLVFGKLTGLGWFVALILILSVIIGRWLGSFLGLSDLFALLGGSCGIIVSFIGVRSILKNITNRNNKR